MSDDELDFYDLVVKRRRVLLRARRWVITICVVLTLHGIHSVIRFLLGDGWTWLVAPVISAGVIVYAVRGVRRWNRSLRYIKNTLDELDRYKRAEGP